METRRNSLFSNNEDKFSKLPDNLIHHILSLALLDMKYAVQTSVLSTRWRYIWTSLPTLNFNSDIFFKHEWESRPMVRFANFVDNVLLLRDSSDIHGFHLIWYDMFESGADTLESRLNTWVLVALRRNVQELTLVVDVDMKFQLPQRLFNCKSLTKLKLKFGGKDWSEIILPKSIDLPCLKALALELFELSVDDVNLRKFLSSCPVLESLIVTACDITTDNYWNLSIYSHGLKHFELDNCGYCCSPDSTMANIIKLNAPNLRSFICKDYMTQDYSLENLSSLVIADIEMKIVGEPDVDEYPEDFSELDEEEIKAYGTRMMKFLRALQNVKELIIAPGFLEVLLGDPELLERRPPQFSNLHYLKMKIWLTRGCLRSIKYLLKISPNIESLCLTITKDTSIYIGDDWETGVSFPCMLSQLKYIEIRGVEGCVNELKLMEFLLKIAMVLEEVVLYRHRVVPYKKVRQLSKADPYTSKSFFEYNNTRLLI